MTDTMDQAPRCWSCSNYRNGLEEGPCASCDPIAETNREDVFEALKAALADLAEARKCLESYSPQKELSRALAQAKASGAEARRERDALRTELEQLRAAPAAQEPLTLTHVERRQTAAGFEVRGVVGATVAWWKCHRDGSIEVNPASTFLSADALATGRRPLVFGDAAPVAQPLTQAEHDAAIEQIRVRG
jgi:hypothetical protein